MVSIKLVRFDRVCELGVNFEMHLQIDLDCLTSILGLGVKCQSTETQPTKTCQASHSPQWLSTGCANRFGLCLANFVGRKDVDESMTTHSSFTLPSPTTMSYTHITLIP